MIKKFTIMLCTLLCSMNIFAEPFKQIIFFGDSLSDNGNLYQVLKIVPKSPPYFNGRFSNGMTWAEHVGKHYYDKYFIDYQNYSYGGATAIFHNPLTDNFIAPITLEGEINSYFLHALFTDKTKVLYVIWMGANDYLYDQEPNINALTDSVVNKTSWAITTLMQQGAREFLILNLPDLAVTPYARQHGNGERLHIISQMHNQKLDAAIQNLINKYPNAQFVTVNIYNIFNDLLANPEKYNQQYGQHIKDTIDACWKGTVFQNKLAADKINLTAELRSAFADKHTMGKNFDTQAISNYILSSPDLSQAYLLGKAYQAGMVPCDNASEHVFWDDLHPTAVLHQMLGSMVVESLENAGLG
ncbi:MAG: hypothetical protein ACD_45C00716G0002 [uncultured bacterium]|nr:MAG: hypothetical protein ACD_45C00716G0002 [uncultured bacterium]